MPNTTRIDSASSISKKIREIPFTLPKPTNGMNSRLSIGNQAIGRSLAYPCVLEAFRFLMLMRLYHSGKSAIIRIWIGPSEQSA